MTYVRQAPGEEVNRSRCLCLSQIKSEYIGDAARLGLEGEEYALPSEPGAIGAVPTAYQIRVQSAQNRTTENASGGLGGA